MRPSGLPESWVGTAPPPEVPQGALHSRERTLSYTASAAPRAHQALEREGSAQTYGFLHWLRAAPGAEKPSSGKGSGLIRFRAQPSMSEDPRLPEGSPGNSVVVQSTPARKLPAAFHLRRSAAWGRAQVCHAGCVSIGTSAFFPLQASVCSSFKWGDLINPHHGRTRLEHRCSRDL